MRLRGEHIVLWGRWLQVAVILNNAFEAEQQNIVLYVSSIRPRSIAYIFLALFGVDKLREWQQSANFCRSKSQVELRILAGCCRSTTQIQLTQTTRTGCWRNNIADIQLYS
jgi:hypothetical protein